MILFCGLMHQIVYRAHGQLREPQLEYVHCITCKYTDKITVMNSHSRLSIFKLKLHSTRSIIGKKDNFCTSKYFSTVKVRNSAAES